MTGASHRVGGMLAALAGYSILHSKGMLIADVNPVLQLAVIYPFAIYGSVFPDLDHGKDSIPSQDICSIAVNRLLHLSTSLRDKNGKQKLPVLSVFDAKHRSWQTHSDLFLLVTLALSVSLISGYAGSANGIILRLVATGFILGVISHLILDMLTTDGIWSIVVVLLRRVFNLKNLPSKIHLVPKSGFFATDGPWEGLVRRIMWVLNIILFIRILYSMLPFHLVYIPWG